MGEHAPWRAVDRVERVSDVEPSRRREIIARLIVVVALIMLGAGTIGGSSPSIPDDTVYAIASWITAGIWLVSTFLKRDKATREIADAALLALAIMRAAGYVYDFLQTQNQGLLAAIAAWAIIAGLSARPLRSQRR